MIACCERFTEMAKSNNGDTYDILAGDGYVADCEYCPFCGAEVEFEAMPDDYDEDPEEEEDEE